MSNELCKHCLTPLDFGIGSCGCDGKRIGELEAEVAELRGMIKRHSDELLGLCAANASEGRCNDYTIRQRECPDCPKAWMIGEFDDFTERCTPN